MMDQCGFRTVLFVEQKKQSELMIGVHVVMLDPVDAAARGGNHRLRMSHL